MEQYAETLCPACFHHTLKNGVCTTCGYTAVQSNVVSMALAPFTVLNHRYMLGKTLGVGGFGITYTAKDQTTGQLCCLKEYFPASLDPMRDGEGSVLIQEPQRDEYEQGMRRFIEEAGLLKELEDNVSVVNIHDSFLQNNTAYFVMELLRGCNMRTFQKQHTAEQNYRLALQMLFFAGSALIEVHRFGIIHGDISPENIFVTADGDIKIIDFGAARAFANRSSKASGKIYLKPGYAPYEQYSLKPFQGPWTDVYSLAATFYMVVTGQRLIDAISRAKGQGYEPLYKLSPLVSKKLSGVIDQALAFDYHDRYQNMSEFMNDLDTVVSDSDMDLDVRTIMQNYAVRVETHHSAEADKDKDKACEVSARKEVQNRRFGLFSFAKKHMHRAYLELYVNGQKEPRRWLLPAGREIVMGRRENSYVKLPSDNLISREHCKLLYNEKERSFVVRDISKYGTYLSGGQRMVKETPYTLKENDVFYVLSKKYRFRVTVEEA